MTLTLPQFLFALISLVFLWVVLDWCWTSLRDRAVRRIAARRARQCHLCGKAYAEAHRVKISHCPDCAAANSRGGHRRLA